VRVLIDPAPDLPPAWGGFRLLRRPPQGSHVDGEQSLRITSLNLHQPGAPAATPQGCMVNPQAYALVAAVVGSSLVSAERRGSRRGASSLDGFGRRAGNAASTATATATAAPGVVLCVADGIVRIVVHVVAGEDLGGRPRREIDRLIGVAAGKRERRDRKDEAEPLQRPPLLPE
jgi:hypothetical protein